MEERYRRQATNLDRHHQPIIVHIHSLPSAEDFHRAAHMASSMVDIHRIVATIDSHHRDFVHKGSIHMGSIIEHNLHMGFVIASLAFLTCPACPTYLAYFIAACLVIMVVVIELLTKINLAVAAFQIIIKLEVVDHQIDLAELAKLAD